MVKKILIFVLFGVSSSVIAYDEQDIYEYWVDVLEHTEEAFTLLENRKVYLNAELEKLDSKIKHMQEVKKEIENKTKEARCFLGAKKIKEGEEITGETRRLCFSKKLYATGYNAVAEQTDSTPCIAGGTGYNICKLAEAGYCVAAFSQELIDWSMYGKNAPYSKGDIVKVFSEKNKGDKNCNRECVVADAMNARYRNRIDLLFYKEKAYNCGEVSVSKTGKTLQF